MQGEHKVHSDHSLRMTELKKKKNMRYDVKNINVIIQEKKKNMLPSHSLMSHSNIPSWQRLKTCRHINRLTHIRSQQITYENRDLWYT